MMHDACAWARGIFPRHESVSPLLPFPFSPLRPTGQSTVPLVAAPRAVVLPFP